MRNSPVRQRRERKRAWKVHERPPRPALPGEGGGPGSSWHLVKGESVTRRAAGRLLRLPRSLTVASLMGVVLALPACTTRPGEHGSRPAYPLRMEQAETLDIQVTRDVTQITFTNTTARAFGPSRLWLNGAYGRNLGPLEIGETVTLDLRKFVDRHGERFRAGGFFAAEVPETLVLAQLEVEGKLLGLVVVEGKAE